MLARGEHQQVLAHHRRHAGQTAMSHKDALTAERSRWKSERHGLSRARRAHRAVLSGERERLQELRKEHKAALQQNKWLLTLADMMKARG